MPTCQHGLKVVLDASKGTAVCSRVDERETEIYFNNMIDQQRQLSKRPMIDNLDERRMIDQQFPIINNQCSHNQ